MAGETEAEIEKEEVSEHTEATIAENFHEYWTEVGMTRQYHEEDFYNVIAPSDEPIQPEEEEEGSCLGKEDDRMEEEPAGSEGEAEEMVGGEEEEEGDADQTIQKGPRLYASLRQFMTFVYRRRKLIPNRFIRGDKLGQLFLIDNFMRMLQQRYSFIRKKGAEIMTSTKTKMLKAKQRLADSLNLNITIGAQFSVPPTVPGPPRSLQQKYENAVSMCNSLGHPDLFITATANVTWSEIKDRIPAGGTWADHPFLVNEVFKKKVGKLMELICGKGMDRATKKAKTGIFGGAKWWTYSIEFQQRGPPHAHIVVALKRSQRTSCR